MSLTRVVLNVQTGPHHGEPLARLVHAKQLGHGEGYRYPHDFPGHAVDQEYRPTTFRGKRYYEPSGQGRDVPRIPGTGQKAEEPAEDRDA